MVPEMEARSTRDEERREKIDGFTLDVLRNFMDHIRDYKWPRT